MNDNAKNNEIKGTISIKSLEKVFKKIGNEYKESYLDFIINILSSTKVGTDTYD